MTIDLNNLNPEQVKELETKIPETKAVKGYSGFVFMTELMRRYAFDLTSGKRIHEDVDGLRLGCGKANQYETYRTIDGQKAIKATLDLSNGVFPPHMAMAAIAAHITSRDQTTGEAIVVALLQLASAIYSEEQITKERLAAIASKNKPEDATPINELSQIGSDILARSYAITGMGEILNNIIVDNQNIRSDFSSVIGKLITTRNAEAAEGDTLTPRLSDEAATFFNTLLSSITNFATSPGVQDIMVMSEEFKDLIIKKAMVEIDDGEQK